MKKLSRAFCVIILFGILHLVLASCRFSGEDEAWEAVAVMPSADYLSRKAQYLAHCNENSGPGSNSVYGQVCRAYVNAGPFDETALYNSMTKLGNREDCSDFQMNALLRILFIDRSNHCLPDALRDDLKATVLNFKYWLDEPGPDDMVWWSENHQVLFHTAELLAGLLYPDEVFPNSGMTGRQHAEHARPMLHEWLDYRGRFGFSEWHSNVYFNEDMPPLVNLADYADEEAIRTKAAMVLDIMAFDMACNYYKGLYATTHGRTYPDHLVNGLTDSTRTAAWIMADLVPLGSVTQLGAGDFTGSFLATSDGYFTPDLIEQAADDAKDNFEHRQRDSITLEQGADYGIGFSDFDDVMFWWGMTGYMAPEIVEGTFNLVDYYDMWAGNTWSDLTLIRPFVGTQELIGVVTDVAPMTRGAALEAVNTYTYRTPYYQLSGAQDWKPFNWTGQSLQWKAVIDKDCFVVTAFPGAFPLVADFGSDWTGGFVPRATMHKNVGVFQYHLPALGTLEQYLPAPIAPIDWGSILPDYTHAYFPRSKFDEYTQTENWTIGRKGDAYLALYSQAAPVWADTVDLIAYNTDNVWIVEMGDVEHNGAFADFVTAMKNAVVDIGSSVHYESPSQGVIQVGWSGPMLVNGEAVDLGPYRRWDNPYARQEFGTMVTRINFRRKTLVLNFGAPSLTCVRR
ncbi:MAG TPA: hypothetical protein VM658_00820 [bacterium]|nr:hypothetical protein [bacterium]